MQSPAYSPLRHGIWKPVAPVLFSAWPEATLGNIIRISSANGCPKVAGQIRLVRGHTLGIGEGRTAADDDDNNNNNDNDQAKLRTTKCRSRIQDDARQRLFHRTHGLAVASNTNK